MAEREAALSLTKAANERWETRLRNWAGFMIGDGSGLGAKISSAYDLKGRGPPGEGDGVPGLLGDALDTNSLILKLDVKLQRVLIARYVSTMEDAEAAHKLSIHRVTFVNLVGYAKEELERLHNARFHGRPIKSARASLQ